MSVKFDIQNGDLVKIVDINPKAWIKYIAINDIGLVIEKLVCTTSVEIKYKTLVNGKFYVFFEEELEKIS